MPGCLLAHTGPSGRDVAWRAESPYVGASAGDRTVTPPTSFCVPWSGGGELRATRGLPPTTHPQRSPGTQRGPAALSTSDWRVCGRPDGDPTDPVHRPAPTRVELPRARVVAAGQPHAARNDRNLKIFLVSSLCGSCGVLAGVCCVRFGVKGAAGPRQRGGLQAAARPQQPRPEAACVVADAPDRVVSGLDHSSWEWLIELGCWASGVWGLESVF